MLEEDDDDDDADADGAGGADDADDDVDADDASAAVALVVWWQWCGGVQKMALRSSTAAVNTTTKPTPKAATMKPRKAR